MYRKIIFLLVGLLSVTLLSGQNPLAHAANKADYTLIPPFVSAGVPPLVMLVMGRNHKLYYEAYNDASDLNEDGILDVGYNPAIDYYGYFDSYKVYTYDTSAHRFEPAAFTSDKKVTSVNQWSGDFLNYLTMSRMDCIRKVLYGGYRSTDTATETVLQRVYIPQDAHSWGKEYESIARDGYDISEYTPLALPGANLRHLFASTTLSDNGDPLLRVLPDNTHRIWEWVAKEALVCDNSLESTGSNYTGSPSDHNAYEDMVLQFANASHLQGSGAPVNGRIDGSGNPFGSDDYYLTIFEGSLNISNPGTYTFAVDGDDAVEVIIDGTVVAGWYGGHGKCNCTTHNGTITLTSGMHDLECRHQEATGDDNYYLHWNGPDSGNVWETVPASAYDGLTQTVYDVKTPSSLITDYQVRVQVGVAGLLESNCKQYPNGANKPIGLLQRNGESERMMFGLITGSYAKNTSGGVLRKNISSFTDEIDPTTGEFTAVNGIIKTINNFRIVCFDYGAKNYNCNCGWITTHPLAEGECRMWGNPIAEMMYEGLRYFAGKATPTTAFTYSGTTDDSTLGLPLPTWNDPYDTTTGFSYCAKPFMLVISDINPTYDSDQLPGVDNNFGSFTGDVSGLDVSSEADTISTEEGISGSYYIGQVGSNYDGSPSAKTVTSLGDIRGLAPEEPTKEGSYYSASIAHYGRITDVSSADSDQNIITYSVGLASPLPRIEIPIGNQVITLVPFAKSVGGYSIVANQGAFQPTNTIVDFFVEEITPSSGTFRINYEDVEQGADHDMDAIVKYEYVVNADNTVTITLTSTYAAGSIIQHCGYVISGTTADGTYLEVRDFDTGTGTDPDYFLDTPPGELPGGTWNDGAELPLLTSRTFTPGTNPSASLLENPLWYAAKWGAFEEADGEENYLPDLDKEWDKDGNDIPDTYFYVTNPLKLEEQLNKSFADILRRTASGTAASVISSSRSGEGAIYQAIFYPEFKGDSGNTVNWVGNVNTYFIDAYGNMREDSNGNRTLDLDNDKIIKFDGTTVYKYLDSNANGQLESSEETSPIVTNITGIDFLWSAGDWLNTISNTDILTQRSYTGTNKQRYIFTFLDLDGNMVVDDTTIDNSGELLSFISSQSDLYPYVHVIPDPFDAVDSPPYLTGIIDVGVVNDTTAYNTFADTQAERVIKFIRGQDQEEDSSTYSYTIPAMRSRQVNYPLSATETTIDTWRLGDIVYSTPTVVGRPAERYNLLYDDASYTELYQTYQNRRQMIYVGGNDGMLHAFNGGFYDAETKKFWLGCSYNSGTDTYTFNDTGLPLGAEMWAYVPYNLLSHLSWLTESDYNTDYHVAYVDLKPRIFDAKIFTNDTDHPEGWGAVMVVGMRFGGGLIAADTDRDNTLTDASGIDAEPSFTSAYIIMDITNPEAEPKVLAELTLPDLGYTTCYPTVIPMKDKDSTIDGNCWYLMFGSGPAPAVGHSVADTLAQATSTQTGKSYVLDLKWLVEHNEIKMLNSSGIATAGIQTFATLDNNSFISDPITVDYELDFKADAVYFGTIAGDFTSGWGGKLRRIIIDNDDDTTQWTGDSVLIDLSGVHDGQPIVAAPAVAVDDQMNRWLFFGTGRFYNRLDVTNSTTASDQQSFYGIKENRTYNTTTNKFEWDWATIDAADLLDVSGVGVIEGGTTVFDTNSIVTATNFDDLITAVEVKDGWLLDFVEPTERNLGQAALLGGLITFTTYDPSDDACTIEGFSSLYALFYKTGTAFKESVIGTVSGTDEVIKTIDLGIGLTITPNIHTGKGGDGDHEGTAFVQTSTGAIIGIKEIHPLPSESGGVYWMEKMEE